MLYFVGIPVRLFSLVYLILRRCNRHSMNDKILSVGIDIGTTTTQVIFSAITVQNTATPFLIPEVKITDKEIIYKSEIYFTPFIAQGKINVEKLKDIIHTEYEKAGILKKEIIAGAVMITGETARKENAEEVLRTLADFAGDFVVATAGPDLEAILAGFGAGAGQASERLTAAVINFDIGGGTTNVAVFWEGEVIDSFALDIGGRLIRFDKMGHIDYISPRIKRLIQRLQLDIAIGVMPEFIELQKLTDAFAKILLQIYENKSLQHGAQELFIGHQHKGITAERLMFSGGVAEYIYSDSIITTLDDVWQFDDIGPLLGYSIRKAVSAGQSTLLEPKEKIRATVIGVGSHAIAVSGSTIVFDDAILPIKNIPIIRIFHHDSENLQDMYTHICEKRKLYEQMNTAIAFTGPKSPSYVQIKTMATAIVQACQQSSEPIIVIVEHDFAKALGQTMRNLVQGSKQVICIDKIRVDNGDYVDIGKPIACVVPVVIKTLVFKN